MGTPAIRGVLALLLAALLVRFALAPVGQFEGDVTLLREWGHRLARDGPADFYETTDSDHLPGSLPVMWGLGEVTDLTSHEQTLGTETPVLAIKLVGILADLAIVALLFAIGRRLAGERAGLVAAGLYALNPAPIFIASIWGQWDSLSAAFALLSVWLFLCRQTLWALPALTYAVLIKPQLAAVGLVLAIAALRGPRELRPSPAQVGIGAAISAALLVALTLPFDAPPWPGDSSLFERARYALELYYDPTVSGFNVWEFPFPSEVLAGEPDSQTLLLGLSYRTVAIILSLGALVAILLRYAEAPSEDRLLWGCLAVMLALFMLPTRVHERWLLPAVMFSAAVAACDRRYRAVAVLLGLSCFANLFWIYDLGHPALDIPLIADGNGAAPTVFALLNLGLLAFILLRPSRSGTGPNRESSTQ